MKRKNLTSILLGFIFLIGLLLLLYPIVSQYWNSKHQSQMIAEYKDNVNGLKSNEYKKIWDSALEYNKKIEERDNYLIPTDEQAKEYQNVLNIGNNGIMGYLEIPAINVELPIYHGVEAGVLQVGLGHLEWSSLPIGEKNNHTVISGHRGLPSSTLLTDLDKLEIGDTFYIKVLDKVMTYQVDQILIVEPDDFQALMPEKEKDLTTLVTCTPYGVNSHRLLVRGSRVENTEKIEGHISADAEIMDKGIVAMYIAVPFLIIFTVIIFIKYYKRNKKG